MITTTIKERLDLIISELGLSGRAFEKECGLANGSYSSIGNGVGADKLNKILAKYDDISADWLLTGKGRMFRTKGENVEEIDHEDDTGTDFDEMDQDGLPIAGSLNRDEMKTLLLRMSGVISGQQHDVSRLITELERIGERTDRMLNIIEHERGIIHRDGSEKKTGSE